MNHHLFIFTIGPVQSFIAQARKTQDLYAGSQLLSELVKFAFEEAEKNSDSFELIFPFKGAASMPNRFVARLSPKTDIKMFGNDLKAAVFKELLRIAEKEMGTVLFEVAKEQIADFLESYWAAVPFEIEKRDELNFQNGLSYYQVRYQELERLLGAVKNFRDYKQFEEEPGRKCSVNGHYNALFYRKTVNEVKEELNKEGKGKRDLRKTKHLSDKALVVSDDRTLAFSELDSGEGICGVTLLKRCFKKNDTFPSTAGIALAHLIEPVKNSCEYQQLPILLGEKLDSFNHQFLFKENMESQDYWKRQGKDETNFGKANALFKQFEELTKGYKFLKYYAVIVFDADDMGEKFSNCVNIEAHTDLSKRLSKYAEWAKKHVDDGRGKTIYAGGDDFLGMLNLTTLFDTMQEMRAEFGEKFKTEGMTFSAGIAIAHYKTPLGEVLNYARKMEKKAKDYKQGKKEKDAFGLVVMKHSGEVLETVLPWTKKNAPSIWNTTLLKGVHEKLQIGVSAAFIKNLHEELSIWEDNPEGFRPQAEHEINRFISRAKGSVADNAIKDLVSNVALLYEQILTLNTQTFLTALNITDFLNRKVS
jgi:CRISPR-associated protein Cmr2